MTKYIMDSNGVHPLGDVIEYDGNRYVKERECYVIGAAEDDGGYYLELSCGHRLYAGNGASNYCPACGSRVIDE